jgi:hypothetical protein
VPGAVNVPWPKNCNEDGTFKSVKELEKLYKKELGLKQRSLLAGHILVVEGCSGSPRQLATNVTFYPIVNFTLEAPNLFKDRRTTANPLRNIIDSGIVLLTHLVRILELTEKEEWIADTIDAEIERLDSLVADIDSRLLFRAIRARRRQRKMDFPGRLSRLLPTR